MSTPFNSKVCENRMNQNFTESDEIKLDQVLEEYFHHTLHIEKIFVDDIPKERSGKTRFCISTVPALPGLNNQR